MATRTKRTKLSSLEKREAAASYYWEENLKRMWHLKCGKVDLHCFVPCQYGNKSIHAMIEAGGIEGIHYADGYLSLSNLLEKYGVFGEICRESNMKILLDYKGPPLGRTIELEATDDEATVHLDVDKEEDTIETTYDEVTVSVDLDTEEDAKSTYTSDRSATSTGVADTSLNDELTISMLLGGTHDVENIISEKDWGHGAGCNHMPFVYMANALSNLKNDILVGKIRDEVCSLFVFRVTSRDDATIVLVWTKEGYRRRGFSSRLMQEGIGFIVDQAFINGSTSTTPDSRALFQSQKWASIDNDMLAVQLKDLRKRLEAKCDQKGTGYATNDWEEQIPDSVIESYIGIAARSRAVPSAPQKPKKQPQNVKRKRQSTNGDPRDPQMEDEFNLPAASSKTTGSMETIASSEYDSDDSSVANVLGRDVIGHKAKSEEMQAYAMELDALGLHSVPMILKFCKVEHVEKWPWMKPFHKMAFQSWLESKQYLLI